MLPNQFQELLDKYSRGECSPAEEQLILNWYDRIGETEEQNFDVAEAHRAGDNIWRAIDPQRVEVRRLWPRVILRAAAVVIPLIICGAVLLNRGTFSSFVTPVEIQAGLSSEVKTFYKNETSRPMKIQLADSSVVILKPASELRIAGNFGKTTRELHLKGEAFFNVEKDTSRPFLVYANEVVTRVLGTSFNVKAYENDREITVAVKSGKVSVYANKHKTPPHLAQAEEVVLTPNQQMVYHRFREVVSKQLVPEPEVILPDSKLFRMQFENAEVGMILEVLEENYGVEIRYNASDLKRCKLTTSMSDEGLYERIEIICKAIGASYAIGDDAAITILSKGC